ncbi:hypothetical protein MRX96_034349 [Rhipicephalus microplus]
MNRNLGAFVTETRAQLSRFAMAAFTLEECASAVSYSTTSVVLHARMNSTLEHEPPTPSRTRLSRSLPKARRRLPNLTSRSEA